MSSYATLSIDSMHLFFQRNGVKPDLLSVFCDEMLVLSGLGSSRGGESDEADGEAPRRTVELRGPAHVIAMRLDAMGIDEHFVRNRLNADFETVEPGDPEFLAVLSEEQRGQAEQEFAVRSSLDAEEWIRLFRSGRPTPWVPPDQRPVGSRAWLLDELESWDERSLLRLALLAMTDAREVVLDVTDLVEDGWMDPAHRPGDLPSAALQEVRAAASLRAPTVVLTEGKTDAEFLRAGLDVLFPFMADFVRFLDYEGKPEGGAGALVRLIKSFAAAGIANKVIAVFDNDAAAADAQRALKGSILPPNIRVISYPYLELAASYPTLGPPNAQAPKGSLVLADVNGLAASIELYLGRDVLALSNGALRPVQWKTYLAGSACYQGEVLDKEKIHQRFRDKYTSALKEPALIADQDWDGIRMILMTILAVFATPPRDANADARHRGSSLPATHHVPDPPCRVGCHAPVPGA